MIIVIGAALLVVGSMWAYTRLDWQQRAYLKARWNDLLVDVGMLVLLGMRKLLRLLRL